MSRQSIILVAIIIMVVSGITLWISFARQGSSEEAREFPGAPRQFDTTGGQEMRPRWNSQGEGTNDGTPAN